MIKLDGEPTERRPWLCRQGFHSWGASTPNALGHWETRCKRTRCRALLCYSLKPFKR
jgi:hypothetical protein